jgi:hypothetical protein
VRERFASSRVVLSVQTCSIDDAKATVSAFGYSGTISNAALGRSPAVVICPPCIAPRASQRVAFPWITRTASSKVLKVPFLGSLGHQSTSEYALSSNSGLRCFHPTARAPYVRP